MKQTDYGIFIHRTPFSESSIIATFYTRQGGVQKFIFQGAKKKNAVLFPLNVVELTYYNRPDSELGKLTQIEIVHPLTAIAFEPIRSVIAFFIADVLKQTLHTNEKETQQFDFLVQAILELDQTPNVGMFPLKFLVEFCEFIGIAPSENGDEPHYFNMTEGEFHSDYRMGDWCLEGEIVQSLKSLFSGNEIPITQKKACLEVILQYYQIHVPRFNVDNSLEIIREVLY